MHTDSLPVMAVIGCQIIPGSAACTGFVGGLKWGCAPPVKKDNFPSLMKLTSGGGNFSSWTKLTTGGWPHTQNVHEARLFSGRLGSTLGGGLLAPPPSPSLYTPLPWLYLTSFHFYYATDKIWIAILYSLFFRNWNFAVCRVMVKYINKDLQLHQPSLPILTSEPAESSQGNVVLAVVLGVSVAIIIVALTFKSVFVLCWLKRLRRPAEEVDLVQQSNARL